MTWIILGAAWLAIIAVLLHGLRNARVAGERFDQVMADHYDWCPDEVFAMRCHSCGGACELAGNVCPSCDGKGYRMWTR